MIEYSKGTVYLDLVDAEYAMQLAWFHGVEGGLGYRPDLAVEYIDRALEALQSARARLTGGAS